MLINSYNLGGLNLYVNPLIPNFNEQIASQDGQLIRAVNVDSYPYGAKRKRAGYITYLNAADSGSVFSLFSWMLDPGTQLFTYRASGSLLYYSTQGTANWAVCGNGTITPGSQVGYAVLNNTLTISQNNGTTRYSTNGTSFTDTSGAPAGGYLEQYQNKVYLGGTSNVISASVTGDPTNWATSGTSDGTTVTIPGAGFPNRLFKLADRLWISKNTSQSIFVWDGYNLVDQASNLGLSSPYSYGSAEDTGFWFNRLGIVTSSGQQPELISNPIRPFIFNDAGSAIAGTSFQYMPGVVHKFDYFAAAGSMTDDFTYETVPNAILKYAISKNEFTAYTFNDFPNAFHSYRDTTGSSNFIFGNSSGQCFTYGGTALSDNGNAIESIMEFVFHANQPHLQKEWRQYWGFFNPGCQAQVLFATSDTFIKEEKQWTPIGDAKTGVVYFRFPASANGVSTRSRFLYIKIVESSQNARFDYLGCTIEAESVPIP